MTKLFLPLRRIDESSGVTGVEAIPVYREKNTEKKSLKKYNWKKYFFNKEKKFMTHPVDRVDEHIAVVVEYKCALLW